jgi:hypothetical protein
MASIAVNNLHNFVIGGYRLNFGPEIAPAKYWLDFAEDTKQLDIYRQQRHGQTHIWVAAAENCVSWDHAVELCKDWLASRGIAGIENPRTIFINGKKRIVIHTWRYA